MQFESWLKVYINSDVFFLKKKASVCSCVMRVSKEKHSFLKLN